MIDNMNNTSSSQTTASRQATSASLSYDNETPHHPSSTTKSITRPEFRRTTSNTNTMNSSSSGASAFTLTPQYTGVVKRTVEPSFLALSTPTSTSYQSISTSNSNSNNVNMNLHMLHSSHSPSMSGKSGNMPMSNVIPPSALQRQFSTELHLNSPYGAAAPSSSSTSLSALSSSSNPSSTNLTLLGSPQMSAIPALGVSAAYMHQLASPQSTSLQQPQLPRVLSSHGTSTLASARKSYITSPPHYPSLSPPDRTQANNTLTFPFTLSQQELQQQISITSSKSTNDYEFAVPSMAPSSSLSMLHMSYSENNKALNQMAMMQQQHAALPPPRIPLRALTERPLVKLTANLMSTYNGINAKYYAQKKRRQEEKAALLLQQQQLSSSIPSHPQSHPHSTVLPAPRGGLHNSQLDDKDYNYIIVPNERLGAEGRYIVESTIGKGSFGRVVKCFDRHTQQWVAVKIVKSKAAFYRQAQVELNILQSLCKDSSEADKWNIVNMLDSFNHANHQCIVFELLSLNLYELLRNTRFAGVSLKLVAKFAHQLLQTLWWLSSSQRGQAGKVLHCDLKPENILLRNINKSAIKVIDFGSACFAHQKTFTYIQSRFYRAPEILLGLPYHSAIDMFSLGCILVELHTGKPIFDGLDEIDQMSKQIEILGMPPMHMIENNKKAEKYFDKVTPSINSVTMNDLPQLQYQYRPKRRHQMRKSLSIRTAIGDKWQNTELYLLFEDFVKQMLEYDPDLRIKPSQALQHPFLVAIANSSSSAAASSASASTASASQTSIATATTASYSSAQHSTTHIQTNTHANAHAQQQQRDGQLQPQKQSVQMDIVTPRESRLSYMHIDQHIVSNGGGSESMSVEQRDLNAHNNSKSNSNRVAASLPATQIHPSHLTNGITDNACVEQQPDRMPGHDASSEATEPRVMSNSINTLSITSTSKHTRSSSHTHLSTGTGTAGAADPSNQPGDRSGVIGNGEGNSQGSDNILPPNGSNSDITNAHDIDPQPQSHAALPPPSQLRPQPSTSQSRIMKLMNRRANQKHNTWTAYSLSHPVKAVALNALNSNHIDNGNGVAIAVTIPTADTMVNVNSPLSSITTASINTPFTLSPNLESSSPSINYHPPSALSSIHSYSNSHSHSHSLYHHAKMSIMSEPCFMNGDNLKLPPALVRNITGTSIGSGNSTPSQRDRWDRGTSHSILSYTSASSRRPSHSDFDSDIEGGIENHVGNTPSIDTCHSHAHVHPHSTASLEKNPASSAIQHHQIHTQPHFPIGCQKDVSTPSSKNGKSRHKRQSSDMQNNHQCSHHNSIVQIQKQNYTLNSDTPYCSTHIHPINPSTLLDVDSSTSASSHPTASTADGHVDDHVSIYPSSCSRASSCNVHSTSHSLACHTLPIASSSSSSMESPQKLARAELSSLSFHRSQSVRYQPFHDDHSSSSRVNSVNSAPSHSCV